MAVSGSVVRIKSTSSRPNRELGRVVKIYLLGAMKMTAPSGDDMLPRAKKTRAILAYLCLAGNNTALRSRLISLLWDRSPDTQARMSLRHALSELKHAVSPHAPDLIQITREAVRLDPALCWVDLSVHPEAPPRLLEDLDGITPAFDHWLAGERARLEDEVRSRLEEEVQRLVKADAPPQLRAAAARKLISFEPANETAARSLMAAFAQMGDRAQAMREYERCRQALKSMLDIAPAKETVALYEAVRLLSSSGAATAKQGAASAGAALLAETALSAKAEPRADAPLQPSIAVLPFRNLSDEVGHEYTGDGLVEDLIEVLSRIPNLFVISRLSTQAFKNQNRLPQEIGSALSVQYVLSGSIRVIGQRLRLTVELTDAIKGTALWSCRLDEQFFDLFEVQLRLANAIVNRVAPYLHADQVKRARTKRHENLGAFDLFLRAQENMHNTSKEVFDSSEHLFDKVHMLEPNYAAALAWRSYWHVLRVGQGWSPDPQRDSAQADYFARRAVECDPLEPMALAVQGHVLSYLHKNFRAAFESFEKALRINPNAAPAWMWSAAARAWAGEGRIAVEQINRAIALSPFDPLMYAYSMMAGIAYLVDGQCERAVEFLLRSIAENRTYTSARRVYVIALVLCGRLAEARQAAEEALRFEPGLTVAGFLRRYPGSSSDHAPLFGDALAQAGIPLGE